MQRYVGDEREVPGYTEGTTVSVFAKHAVEMLEAAKKRNDTVRAQR